MTGVSQLNSVSRTRSDVGRSPGRSGTATRSTKEKLSTVYAPIGLDIDAAAPQGRDQRARGSALADQSSLGAGGESARLLVAHVHPLDLLLLAQRIGEAVERISGDAVDAFYAGGTQGLQAVNTMEFVVRSLRGWAVPLVIPIPQAWRVFDREGIRDEKISEQLHALGREVTRDTARHDELAGGRHFELQRHVVGIVGREEAAVLRGRGHR